jgi:type VI protein secretion system component VasK
MVYVILILLLVGGVLFYGYGKVVLIGVLLLVGLFVASATICAITSSVGDDKRKAQEAREQAEKAKAELELTRSRIADAEAHLQQTLRRSKEEDELRRMAGFGFGEEP